MVQKAFEVGGFDLVILIECENWQWNPFAIWDSWHAHWLCQINDNYHKHIPQQYFDDWWYQIEYCNEKRLWWTRFYWPDRLVKWMKCKEYVKQRFTFTW